MLNNHQLQLSHVTLRFHQDQLFTFKTEVIIVIEFKFWAAEGKKKKDLLPFPSKKKKKLYKISILSPALGYSVNKNQQTLPLGRLQSPINKLAQNIEDTACVYCLLIVGQAPQRSKRFACFNALNSPNNTGDSIVTTLKVCKQRYFQASGFPKFAPEPEVGPGFAPR